MIFASLGRLQEAWALANFRSVCRILSRRLEMGVISEEEFCEGVALAKKRKEKFLEEAKLLQAQEEQ